MNIKRNKIPKQTRLYSSKPRSISYKKIPTPNRPKTGMIKKISQNLLDNYTASNAKHNNKIASSNMYIDFGESLDFRSVRPKSKCQDRIFNSYWQLQFATPETIFKKKNLFINEDEKNVYIEKSMQEKMQLYKFPQINWTNKNTSHFLSHVGGSKFNLSQTISKITTRPVSSLTGAFRNNNTVFKKIKARPITAFNRLSNKNKVELHRPNTAIRSNKLRPKTAFLNQNREEKMDSIYEINSPAINISDANNNLNENIPSKIKSKFHEKIKNDYNYKDEFFNEISKEDLVDDSDEMNALFKSNENIHEVNQKYKALIKGFEDNQLQSYSIKIDQADTDILELFDRSQ
jgi:hypothetical protein